MVQNERKPQYKNIFYSCFCPPQPPPSPPTYYTVMYCSTSYTYCVRVRTVHVLYHTTVTLKLAPKMIEEGIFLG